MNKLGIDIGGVIIDRKKNDSSDTSLFGPNYLNAFAVEGAFDTIKILHERFAGEVYVVSKCGANIERKSREWLVHNGFTATTGVKMENVHFCRRRSDKAPICEKLGITHFIDDKLEVLSYLTSVKNRYLFDPNPQEVQEYSRFLPLVTKVLTWKELEGAIK